MPGPHSWLDYPRAPRLETVMPAIHYREPLAESQNLGRDTQGESSPCNTLAESFQVWILAKMDMSKVLMLLVFELL